MKGKKLMQPFGLVGTMDVKSLFHLPCFFSRSKRYKKKLKGLMSTVHQRRRSSAGILNRTEALWFWMKWLTLTIENYKNIAWRVHSSIDVDCLDTAYQMFWLWFSFLFWSLSLEHTVWRLMEALKQNNRSQRIVTTVTRLHVTSLKEQNPLIYIIKHYVQLLWLLCIFLLCCETIYLVLPHRRKRPPSLSVM